LPKFACCLQIVMPDMLLFVWTWWNFCTTHGSIAKRAIRHCWYAKFAW